MNRAHSGPQETEVIGEFVLGPCLREGNESDWWKEIHTYCTGSHHMGAYSLVRCSCDCHKPNGRYIVVEEGLLDGLPADLAKLLTDPTIALPGDREVFLKATQWGIAKVREQEAELLRNFRALVRYGKHDEGCQFSTSGTCGCGLLEALQVGRVYGY